MYVYFIRSDILMLIHIKVVQHIYEILPNIPRDRFRAFLDAIKRTTATITTLHDEEGEGRSREYVGVRDSTEDSVRDPAGDTAGDSVGSPAGDSVGPPAGDPAGDPARDPAGDSDLESVVRTIEDSSGDSTGDPDSEAGDEGDETRADEGALILDEISPAPQPSAGGKAKAGGNAKAADTTTSENTRVRDPRTPDRPNPAGTDIPAAPTPRTFTKMVLRALNNEANEARVQTLANNFISRLRHTEISLVQVGRTRDRLMKDKEVEKVSQYIFEEMLSKVPDRLVMYAAAADAFNQELHLRELRDNTDLPESVQTIAAAAQQLQRLDRPDAIHSIHRNICLIQFSEEWDHILDLINDTGEPGILLRRYLRDFGGSPAQGVTLKSWAKKVMCNRLNLSDDQFSEKLKSAAVPVAVVGHYGLGGLALLPVLKGK